MPFWRAIISARASSSWNGADLVHAARLARCHADIERVQSEIDEEGEIDATSNGMILLPEFGRRAWVEGGAVGTGRFNGKLFYSSSAPLWEGLNPQYLTDPVANEPRLRRPLLNDLIAIRTTVKADTFKFPSITNQAAQSRYRRIAEGVRDRVPRGPVERFGAQRRQFAARSPDRR